MHGAKGSLQEGAIATHAIFHWPASLTAKDAIVSAEGHVIDILPTILEVTGSSYPVSRSGHAVPPVAGESLLGLLQGGEFQRAQPLFWDYDGQQAVIRSSWKLLKEDGGLWQLFNLQADPLETRDLSRRHPDLVAELVGLHRDWARANNVLPREVVDAARGK
jgi:arylsulfatase